MISPLRIDLHMHSTASDGAYAPAEVVAIAQSKAMDVIALTDHDTIDGVAAAQAAALGTSLRVVAGVELSAEDEKADRHILGYLLDTQSPTLLSFFAMLQQERLNRVVKILAKLEAIGLSLSIDEVRKAAGQASALGRPHIARAMVRNGLVPTLQQAFDFYIGDGRPAYEPHFKLAPARAVDLIHKAGGVAVLAHAVRYPNYLEILDELVGYGIDGVEVYYPDHPPALIETLRNYANQHNLIITVGSDFHRRDADGSARIGTVKYPPTADIFGALTARAARYKPPNA
jgi:3',5'-nucleoside bisphosphate phosphatase